MSQSHCLQLWQRWQDVILQVECLRIQESRVPEGGLWWSVPYIVLHWEKCLMGLACLSLPIFRWRSLGTNEARLACVLHGLLSGSIVAIWQRLCVFMYIRGCSREDVIFVSWHSRMCTRGTLLYPFVVYSLTKCIRIFDCACTLDNEWC